MRIIPSINCPDWNCVKSRLDIVKEIGVTGVQFDVADGRFVGWRTWDEPLRLISDLEFQVSDLFFEAHLMVRNPGEEAEKWLEAGAKRLSAHLESASQKNIKDLVELTNSYGAEFFAALNPQTPPGSVKKIEKVKIAGVLVLGVNPGPSGQGFQKNILDKIKTIRKMFPKLALEVDGGVHENNLESIKKAGADEAVSGSYIFNNKEGLDPKEAYHNLVNLI